MMLNFNLDVKCEFIAEPITTQNRELIGVEVLSRIYTNVGAYTLDVELFISCLSYAEKRRFIINQLTQIKLKSKFFLELGLLCSVNIDYDLALIIINDNEINELLDELSFIRLEVSETFFNLSDGLKNPLLNSLYKKYKLWLDDLGAGSSNIELVKSGIFEFIKVDKLLFWKSKELSTLPDTINDIEKYCKNIIIEGVEDIKHLKSLNFCTCYIQGYINPSVTLYNIDKITHT